MPNFYAYTEDSNTWVDVFGLTKFNPIEVLGRKVYQNSADFVTGTPDFVDSSGREPGPMVELTSSFHKKYHKALHGLIENGRSFRNNKVLHNAYESFRKKYWKERAKGLHH